MRTSLSHHLWPTDSYRALCARWLHLRQEQSPPAVQVNMVICRNQLHQPSARSACSPLRDASGALERDSRGLPIPGPARSHWDCPRCSRSIPALDAPQAPPVESRECASCGGVSVSMIQLQFPHLSDWFCPQCGPTNLRAAGPGPLSQDDAFQAAAARLEASPSSVFAAVGPTAFSAVVAPAAAGHHWCLQLLRHLLPPSRQLCPCLRRSLPQDLLHSAL